MAPRKWWTADSPTQESPNTDGLGVIHVKGQKGVRPISDRQTNRDRSHKYIKLANFQLFLYTYDWRQRPKVLSFPPLVNPPPHYRTPADEPARQVWGWIRAHLPQTCGTNSLFVFGRKAQHWVGEGSSQTLKPRLPSGRGGASASPAHLCLSAGCVCFLSPIKAFLHLLTLSAVSETFPCCPCYIGVSLPLNFLIGRENTFIQGPRQ